MSLKQWLMLVLLSVLWGASFFFNAILLRQLGPITITFGRTALAAIVLLIVLRIQKITIPRDRTLWLGFTIIGLLNNLLPYTLIAWGQRSIDSGLASIFNATMPIWSVLLGHLLTNDEKLTWNKTLGVLLGFSGVIVLIGPDALAGIGNAVLAQLAVVLAAVLYACAAIFGKRFRGQPPALGALGMVGTTAIMSLPFALYFEQFQAISPTPESWLALLGIGAFCTPLGYFLYFTILSGASATNLSLVTLLTPVSALMLGTIFLDEPITPSLLVGMALILSGLIAVDGRVFKR